MAKKLSKGKRKHLIAIVDRMATNVRAEKARNARISSIRNDLCDHRGRRAIDYIF